MVRDLMSGFRALVICCVSCQALLSCADLTTKVPAPQIDAPVLIKPAKSVGFGLSMTPGNDYEVSSDASRRPPDVANPDARKEDLYNAELLYSVDDNIQLGLAYTPLDGAIGLSGLYHLLGTPQSGFQWAIQGRVGMANQNEDGDQNGEFGAGGYDWQSSTRTLYGSVGSSTGFYLNPETLLFTGIAVGQVKLDAEIDQDPSENGSDLGGRYNFEDSGNQLTLGVGLHYGQRQQFQLSYQYSNSNYEKASSISLNRIYAKVFF